MSAVAAKLEADPPTKRYQVTCYDHVTRHRITIGWSDDHQLAQGLAEGADARPTWSDGKVIDHGVRP